MIPVVSKTGSGQAVVPGNRWDLLNGMGDDVVDVDISVVVPYFENQPDLDLLLEALTRQTHPRSGLQVVIADDGSSRPPDVGAGSPALDVVVVRQADLGFRAGAARNLGASAADGSVLLFLDGDTVPEPEYTARLARLPALLPDALVGGRRRYADLQAGQQMSIPGANGVAEFPEPEWLVQEYRRSRNLLAVHPRSYKYLIGAVLGCSRELFDDISGFDESFVGYGGEDYDFSYRAFTAGAVLAHVPDAVAWHHGPDWAARTAAQEQTPQKNREMLTLAARIPEPSMRGGGQIYPIADVVLTATVEGWSLGAGVVALRSFLTVLDCRVVIAGRGEGADLLSAAFSGDPRVRRESGEDAVPGAERWFFELTRPVRADEEFGDFLARQTLEDVGTFQILLGPESLLRARSARSRWRGRRHGEVPAAERERWFEHREFGPADCGLDPIDAEPALARIFGRY